MQITEMAVEGMRALRVIANFGGAYDTRPKEQLHAHVFDNGGKTVDRYTIYVRTGALEKFQVYTMSADPFSPQGVNQFSHEVQTPAEFEVMSQAIPFNSLPFDIVLAILERVTA